MQEAEKELAPMTDRDEWQQRVIDEHHSLSEKQKKLTSFLDNLTNDMNQTDLSLLRIQKSAMSSYANVLLARIARF